MDDSNQRFWYDLFLRLEDIKSIAPDDEGAQQNLRDNIDHIASVYDRHFDPVEHFNEFTVVRLLREISSKLG